MAFLDIARSRHSVRLFSSRPVEDGLREKLLQAALMSPSSMSTKGWEFVVVDNRDLLDKLSVSKKSGAKFLTNAPLAVVVCVDTEKSHAWVEDASIASLMMQLEAEGLGLGSCWIQIRGRKNEDEKDSEEVVRNLLGIPEKYGVLSVIAIGYKKDADAKKEEQTLLWDRVHKNVF